MFPLTGKRLRFASGLLCLIVALFGVAAVDSPAVYATTATPWANVCTSPALDPAWKSQLNAAYPASSNFTTNSWVMVSLGSAGIFYMQVASASAAVFSYSSANAYDSFTVTNAVGYKTTTNGTAWTSYSTSMNLTKDSTSTPCFYYQNAVTFDSTWTAQHGSQQASPYVVTPPPTVPAAPTLTGTLGNAQNTLTWGSVSGASSYTLYRNNSVVYTGTALSYIDTGLANGTAYQYNATATNSTGESAKSSAVTLTPHDPSYDLTNEHKTLIAAGITLYVTTKIVGMFRYRQDV